MRYRKYAWRQKWLTAVIEFTDRLQSTWLGSTAIVLMSPWDCEWETIVNQTTPGQPCKSKDSPIPSDPWQVLISHVYAASAAGRINSRNPVRGGRPVTWHRMRRSYQLPTEPEATVWVTVMKHMRIYRLVMLLSFPVLPLSRVSTPPGWAAVYDPVPGVRPRDAGARSSADM